MTPQVREWLPTGAVEREAVRAMFDRVVRDWSSDWFADRRFETARPRSLGGGSSLGEGRRTYGGVVRLSVAPAAARRLAGWALDAPVPQLELAPADEALVERFEGAMFADLVGRVESLLDAGKGVVSNASPGQWGGGTRVRVEIDVAEGAGAPLLSLTLPIEAVVALCKATLPSVARHRTPVCRLRDAVSQTTVTIEASLGRAEIGVADLRRLTKGDVIVLDRALDEGLSLDLAGTDQAIATARLGETAGRMTLTLHN